jgi:hypothetical protein
MLGPVVLIFKGDPMLGFARVPVTTVPYLASLDVRPQCQKSEQNQEEQRCANRQLSQMGSAALGPSKICSGVAMKAHLGPTGACVSCAIHPLADADSGGSNSRLCRAF